MKFLKAFTVLFLLAMPFFIGCNGKKRTAMKSPEGYDLNKPFVIKLPPLLDEISGISFYPKDNSVFAIVDELGILYKIKLEESPEINKWKFYKTGDFEDMVQQDSIFYALLSKGSVVRFNFAGKEAANVETFKLDLEGKNEFEILYHDAVAKKLVLICKDCAGDKKSFTTAYSFDMTNKSFDTSTYTIDVTKIAEMLGEKKIKFKPSAASINPVTGELFMISAVNKALVVTDRLGVVKSVFHLDPQVFKQPEGLCFTPKGDLIISNESADIGAANILIYKYKKRA